MTRDISVDRLHGPELKIQRAETHAHELERLEIEFVHRQKPRIVFDTETEPGHKLVKVVLDARPPDVMQMLAAEAIYHLRSCLDQLMVALARASNDAPGIRNIHFPTGDSVKGFETSFARNTVGLDEPFRELVYESRAYDGGNETLRRIFRLANTDKHIELLPISTGDICNILLEQFTIEDAYTAIVLAGGQRLDEGVVIADLMPHGKFAPRNDHAKLEIGVQIMIGEPDGNFAPAPLRTWMPDAVASVRQILRRARHHLDVKFST